MPTHIIRPGVVHRMGQNPGVTRLLGGKGAPAPLPPARDPARTTGFFDPVLDRKNAQLLVNDPMTEYKSFPDETPIQFTHLKFSPRGCVAIDNDEIVTCRIENGNPFTIPGEWYLQFDIESGFFEEGVHSADRTGLITDGSILEYGIVHESATDNYIDKGSDLWPGMKTIGNGTNGKVRVTASNSDARGFELFLDHCLVHRGAKWNIAPSGFLNIGGSGNLLDIFPQWHARSDLDHYMSDFMFLGIPYTPGTAKRYTYLGDSFTKWGAHPSGKLSNDATPADDPNDAPYFQGWAEDSDTSFNARYENRQRTFSNVLIGYLQRKGHYVTDEGFVNYGRGAAVIDPANVPNPDFSPLSERIDSALSGGTPPGGGPGQGDTCVIQCGTNDVWVCTITEPADDKDNWWLAKAITAANIMAAEVKRLVADGYSEVIILGLAADIGAVERGYWQRYWDFENVLYAIMSGEDNVTYVKTLEAYGTSTSVRTPGDPVHPNAKGMRILADQVDAILPDLVT